MTGDEQYRTLPDDMDFLLYPVSEGLCSYESIKDGTLTLEDFLIMNVHLQNKAYNAELSLRMQNGKRA